MSRRYDFRPAMPEFTLNRLSMMFERRALNIPSLRTLGLRCGLLPWILDEHRHGSNVVNLPKEIFRMIQMPLKKNITLINDGLYTVEAFVTVPLWNELANDLVIRPESCVQQLTNNSETLEKTISTVLRCLNTRIMLVYYNYVIIYFLFIEYVCSYRI